MFTCFCRGGECLETFSPMQAGSPAVPDPLKGTALLPVIIEAPVGLNCINKRRDVQVIQRALNAVAVEDGGPEVKLKVDGFYGPKTRAAIFDFQMRHLGPFTDEVVQPFRRTVKELNAMIGKGMRQATMDDLIAFLGFDKDQVLASLKQAFVDARRWLALAVSRIQSPTDDLVEKYFQISQQPGGYPAVKQIVLQMKQAIDRQDIEELFRPEPMIRTTDTYAWCGHGGFFESPLTTVFLPAPDGQNYPISPRNIFITPIFILLLSQIGMSYAIVHELAHYCSKAPVIVTDFQYQHRDQDAFAKLAPAKRIRNADHYGVFVLESGTGAQKSPLIV